MKSNAPHFALRKIREEAPIRGPKARANLHQNQDLYRFLNNLYGSIDYASNRSTEVRPARAEMPSICSPKPNILQDFILFVKTLQVVQTLDVESFVLQRPKV